MDSRGEGGIEGNRSDPFTLLESLLRISKISDFYSSCWA